MNAIEAELVKAVHLTVVPKQDRQKMLARLVRGISELAEDAWKGLSEEAQAWSNKATEALETKNPIPDFEGGQANGEDVMAQTETTEGSAAGKAGGKSKKKAAPKAAKAKAAAPKAAKKKAAPKAAKAKAAAPKAAAPKAGKKPKMSREERAIEGVKGKIKAFLAHNRDASSEAIMAHLKTRGIANPSKSTVELFRADFRHSLIVLEHLGMLRTK